MRGSGYVVYGCVHRQACVLRSDVVQVSVIAEIVDAPGVLIDQEILPLLLIELAHVDGLEELLLAALRIVVEHVYDVFVLEELREVLRPGRPLVYLCHADPGRRQLGVQVLQHGGGEHLTGPDLVRVYREVELVLKRRHEIHPLGLLGRSHDLRHGAQVLRLPRQVHAIRCLIILLFCFLDHGELLRGQPVCRLLIYH